MEAGKKKEEAGPSSATAAIDGFIEEKKKREEVNEKKAEEEDGESVGTIGGDSDDEEQEEQGKNGGEIGDFVPGPLLSLKDQIEKDKVYFSFFISIFLGLINHLAFGNVGFLFCCCYKPTIWGFIYFSCFFHSFCFLFVCILCGNDSMLYFLISSAFG